jgi:nucleoside-diphosphate-sugar epimerase
MSNDPTCDLDPSLTHAINFEGTLQAARLAVAAGASRFIFASSCSVYGCGTGIELTETAEVAPVSLYARLKVEAERRLVEVGQSTGLKVTILRLATVFGLSRRMRFDLAVNLMTKNAYVSRKIVVEGGGRQWRPFVHVVDVAQAIQLALDAPGAAVAGKIFNVGSSSDNLRIMNLAFRVRDLIPGTEIMLTPTDVDRRDYNVSFAQIQRSLGFKPQHTIESGVSEILEALRRGDIDPDDRRWYTLRHYKFLAEVEQVYRDVALEGRVLR